MITFKLREAQLSAQLRELARVTGKEALTIVLDEGRLLAQDLVRLTPPFSTAPSTESFSKQRQAGEKAVERDINRVFHVVDLDKIHSPRVRARLEVLVRKRDLEGIKALLKACNIPAHEVLREVDPKLHAFNRDRRGRVQRSKRIWVLNGRSVNSYVRKIKSHVGQAKAGWAASAQALGVRLPAWITRHGSGGGSFKLDKKPGAPKITLRNDVPYIQASGGDLQIVERAMKNRIRNIKAKLEKIARSGWRKKG